MTLTITPRSTWGARHADGDLTIAGLATGVALHHTAFRALPATATPEQEMARMRAIEATGQSRFGTGISYRGVLIFPSGRAYQGTSWNRRGTHVGGRNSDLVAIAFDGDFRTDRPTPAALATAAAVMREGRGRWFTAAAALRPHSHWTATVCPGPHLLAHLSAIAAGTAGSPTPAPAPAPAPAAPAGRTVAQMAEEVIAGRHGTGHDQRRRSLGVDAAKYALVRAEVNRRLTGRPAPAPAPVAPPAPAQRTIAQMADEVIRGRHGTGHAARQRSLGINAATYAKVRAEVNRRLR